MPKLQCSKCNYEFDKEKIPKRCPYCSAEDSIILYKTAQDWVDETQP
jgi:predicted Zn-ribbon and HTH transcriptional regulator|tara:strand:- start:63 stop:203 length:141 start_codon:yes stop_codon:yes gene_type:complete